MANSDQDQAVLVELVRRVTRAFYTHPHILIMDLIAAKGELRDEELVAATKIPSKELARFCQKLKEDRLLSSESKETNINQKILQRNTYYIDFIEFINAVRLRIALVNRRIQRDINAAEERQSFRCPICRRTYDLTDAQRLLDYATGEIRCEDDKEILAIEGDKALSKMTHETYQKFARQTEKLVELLSKTDSMKIEAHKRAEKLTKEQKQLLRADKPLVPERKIAVLLRDPANSSLGSDGKIKSEAGPAKVQELPIWHQFSTVTGERIVNPKSTNPTGGVSGSSTHVPPDAETDEKQKHDLAAYLANYQGNAASSDAESDEEDFSDVGSTIAATPADTASPSYAGTPAYSGPAGMAPGGYGNGNHESGDEERQVKKAKVEDNTVADEDDDDDFEDV